MFLGFGLKFLCRLLVQWRKQLLNLNLRQRNFSSKPKHILPYWHSNINSYMVHFIQKKRNMLSNNKCYFLSPKAILFLTCVPLPWIYSKMFSICLKLFMLISIVQMLSKMLNFFLAERHYLVLNGLFPVLIRFNYDVILLWAFSFLFSSKGKDNDNYINCHFQNTTIYREKLGRGKNTAI